MFVELQLLMESTGLKSLPLLKTGELPNGTHLKAYLENDQLSDLAHHLQNNFKIDYKEIRDTAKSLNTLDEQVLEEVQGYFS